MNTIEERTHGDVTEHRHLGYDYWHPATRVHSVDIPDEGLPMGHILAPVVPYCGEEEVAPKGLQATDKFDWQAWDAACEAKGMCQGISAITVLSPPNPASNVYSPTPSLGSPVLWSEWETEWSYSPPQEVIVLHHRKADPFFSAIVPTYWQCHHCRPLQKWYQWASGNRITGFQVSHRGERELVFVETSGAEYLFVLNPHHYTTICGIASGISDFGHPVYGERWSIFVLFSGQPPQVLPEEIGIILARRLWYKLTKGAWSDVPKEDC